MAQEINREQIAVSISDFIHKRLYLARTSCEYDASTGIQQLPYTVEIRVKAFRIFGLRYQPEPIMHVVHADCPDGPEIRGIRGAERHAPSADRIRGRL